MTCPIINGSDIKSIMDSANGKRIAEIKTEGKLSKEDFDKHIDIISSNILTAIDKPLNYHIINYFNVKKIIGNEISDDVKNQLIDYINDKGGFYIDKIKPEKPDNKIVKPDNKIVKPDNEIKESDNEPAPTDNEIEVPDAKIEQSNDQNGHAANSIDKKIPTSVNDSVRFIFSFINDDNNNYIKFNAIKGVINKIINNGVKYSSDSLTYDDLEKTLKENFNSNKLLTAINQDQIINYFKHTLSYIRNPVVEYNGQDTPTSIFDPLSLVKQEIIEKLDSKGATDKVEFDGNIYNIHNITLSEEDKKEFKELVSNYNQIGVSMKNLTKQELEDEPERLRNLKNERRKTFIDIINKMYEKYGLVGNKNIPTPEEILNQAFKDKNQKLINAIDYMFSPKTTINSKIKLGIIDFNNNRLFNMFNPLYNIYVTILKPIMDLKNVDNKTDTKRVGNEAVTSYVRSSLLLNVTNDLVKFIENNSNIQFNDVQKFLNRFIPKDNIILKNAIDPKNKTNSNKLVIQELSIYKNKFVKNLGSIERASLEYELYEKHNLISLGKIGDDYRMFLYKGNKFGLYEIKGQFKRLIAEDILNRVTSGRTDMKKNIIFDEDLLKDNNDNINNNFTKEERDILSGEKYKNKNKLSIDEKNELLEQINKDIQEDTFNKLYNRIKERISPHIDKLVDSGIIKFEDVTDKDVNAKLDEMKRDLADTISISGETDQTDKLKEEIDSYEKDKNLLKKKIGLFSELKDYLSKQKLDEFNSGKLTKEKAIELYQKAKAYQYIANSILLHHDLLSLMGTHENKFKNIRDKAKRLQKLVTSFNNDNAIDNNTAKSLSVKNEQTGNKFNPKSKRFNIESSNKRNLINNNKVKILCLKDRQVGESNSTDGLSIIDHRTLLLQLLYNAGEISNSNLNNYSKEEFVSPDKSLKYVIVNNGYIKFSIVPTSNFSIDNEIGNKIYNFMRANGYHGIFFESAIKENPGDSFKRDYFQIFNKDGSLILNKDGEIDSNGIKDEHVLELDVNDFKHQQQQHLDISTNASLPSQIISNMNGIIDPEINTIKIAGKDVNIKGDDGIIKTWQKLLSKITNKIFNDNIGNDNKIKYKFYKQIDNLDSYTKNTFKQIFDSNKKSIFYSDKIGQIILKLFNNNIGDIKLEGMKLNQYSGFVFDKVNDKKSDQYDNVTWLNDKYKNGNENGRRLYIENNTALVVVPFNFKDSEGNKLDLSDFIDKNTGNIDTNKLPESLLDIVGFRLPNDSKRMQFAMKVVGFSTESNNIFIPEEVATIMGSDFDIDALYTYRRNSEYKDGKLNVKGSKGEYKSKSIEEINKAKDTNDLTNSIFDMMHSILSDDNVFNKLINKPLDNIDQWLNGLLKSQIKPTENNIMGSTISESNIGNNIKNDTIGPIYGNYSVLINILKEIVNMDDKNNVISFYHEVKNGEEKKKENFILNINGQDLTSFGNHSIDDQGHNFFDWVSAIASHSLDRAKKDLQLYSINMTPRTIGAFQSLFSLAHYEEGVGKGIDIDTFFKMINNPIMKQIISLMEENGTSLSQGINDFIKNKGIENACKIGDYNKNKNKNNSKIRYSDNKGDPNEDDDNYNYNYNNNTEINYKIKDGKLNINSDFLDRLKNDELTKNDVEQLSNYLFLFRDQLTKLAGDISNIRKLDKLKTSQLGGTLNDMYNFLYTINKFKDNIRYNKTIIDSDFLNKRLFSKDNELGFYYNKFYNHLFDKANNFTNYNIYNILKSWTENPVLFQYVSNYFNKTTMNEATGEIITIPSIDGMMMKFPGYIAANPSLYPNIVPEDFKSFFEDKSMTNEEAMKELLTSNTYIDSLTNKEEKNQYSIFNQIRYLKDYLLKNNNHELSNFIDNFSILLNRKNNRIIDLKSLSNVSPNYDIEKFKNTLVDIHNKEFETEYMNQNPEFADTMTKFKDSLIRYSLLVQDAKIQKLREFIPAELYDAYNIVGNIDDYYNKLDNYQLDVALSKLSESMRFNTPYEYVDFNKKYDYDKKEYHYTNNNNKNKNNDINYGSTGMNNVLGAIDNLSNDNSSGEGVRDLLDTIQGNLPNSNDINIEYNESGEGMDKFNGKFEYINSDNGEIIPKITVNKSNIISNDHMGAVLAHELLHASLDKIMKLKDSIETNNKEFINDLRAKHPEFFKTLDEYDSFRKDRLKEVQEEIKTTTDEKRLKQLKEVESKLSSLSELSAEILTPGDNATRDYLNENINKDNKSLFQKAFEYIKNSIMKLLGIKPGSHAEKTIDFVLDLKNKFNIIETNKDNLMNSDAIIKKLVNDPSFSLKNPGIKMPSDATKNSRYITSIKFPKDKFNNMQDNLEKKLHGLNEKTPELFKDQLESLKKGLLKQAFNGDDITKSAILKIVNNISDHISKIENASNSKDLIKSTQNILSDRLNKSLDNIIENISNPQYSNSINYINAIADYINKISKMSINHKMFKILNIDEANDLNSLMGNEETREKISKIKQFIDKKIDELSNNIIKENTPGLPTLSEEGFNELIDQARQNTTNVFQAWTAGTASYSNPLSQIINHLIDSTSTRVSLEIKRGDIKIKNIMKGINKLDERSKGKLFRRNRLGLNILNGAVDRDEFNHDKKNVFNGLENKSNKLNEDEHINSNDIYSEFKENGFDIIDPMKLYDKPPTGTDSESYIINLDKEKALREELINKYNGDEFEADKEIEAIKTAVEKRNAFVEMQKERLLNGDINDSQYSHNMAMSDLEEIHKQFNGNSNQDTFFNNSDDIINFKNNTPIVPNDKYIRPDKEKLFATKEFKEFREFFNNDDGFLPDLYEENRVAYGKDKNTLTWKDKTFDKIKSFITIKGLYDNRNVPLLYSSHDPEVRELINYYNNLEKNLKSLNNYYEYKLNENVAVDDPELKKISDNIGKVNETMDQVRNKIITIQEKYGIKDPEKIMNAYNQSYTSYKINKEIDGKLQILQKLMESKNIDKNLQNTVDHTIKKLIYNQSGIATDWVKKTPNFSTDKNENKKLAAEFENLTLKKKEIEEEININGNYKRVHELNAINMRLGELNANKFYYSGSKAVNSLQNLNSFTTFLWNGFSFIRNSVLGKVSDMQYFKSMDIKGSDYEGINKYYREGSIIANKMVIGNNFVMTGENKKYLNFLKAMNVMQTSRYSVDEVKDEQLEKIFSKKFFTDPYLLFTQTDASRRLSFLIAHSKLMKIKDGKGNDISLFDGIGQEGIYDLEKKGYNGKEYKDMTDEEKEKAQNEIDAKYADLSARTKRYFNRNDISTVVAGKDSTWYNILFMYKSYLNPFIIKRVGNQTFDPSTGKIDEGYFRTLGKQISSIYNGSDKVEGNNMLQTAALTFKMMYDTWMHPDMFKGNLDHYQIANIRRAGADLATFLLFSTAYQLVKSQVKKMDPEDRGIYNVMLNLSYVIMQDNNQTFNPLDFSQSLMSQVALGTQLLDYEKVLKNSIEFGFDQSSTQWEKLKGQAEKVIPILRQYHMWNYYRQHLLSDIKK